MRREVIIVILLLQVVTFYFLIKLFYWQLRKTIIVSKNKRLVYFCINIVQYMKHPMEFVNRLIRLIQGAGILFNVFFSIHIICILWTETQDYINAVGTGGVVYAVNMIALFGITEGIRFGISKLVDNND